MIMSKNKRDIRQKDANKQMQIPSVPSNSDKAKPIWLFDWLDNDGDFAFDLSRKDFDHHEFLDKMIRYSNMTWSKIKQQTHDKGKSKHHLLNYESLSKAAKERIEAKGLGEHIDAIFSFALQNRLRIIGIREGERFHVVWYDSEHQFCPTRK